MNKHNINIGKIGEASAVKFLKKRGYKIIFKNWRCIFGEIDIVAQEKGFLVFVEIKTRSSHMFGRGYEAVDAKKQKKLIQLGQAFLKRYSLFDRPCRIDIASLQIGPDNKIKNIELIKDAF